MRPRANLYIRRGDSRRNAGLLLRGFSKREVADLENKRHRLHGSDQLEPHHFECVQSVARSSGEILQDQMQRLPLPLVKEGRASMDARSLIQEAAFRYGLGVL